MARRKLTEAKRKHIHIKEVRVVGDRPRIGTAKSPKKYRVRNY